MIRTGPAGFRIQLVNRPGRNFCPPMRTCRRRSRLEYRTPQLRHVDALGTRMSRGAGERHPTLPADQAAEPAVAALDYNQRAAIAQPSQQALAKLRHQLALSAPSVSVVLYSVLPARSCMPITTSAPCSQRAISSTSSPDRIARQSCLREHDQFCASWPASAMISIALTVDAARSRNTGGPWTIAKVSRSPIG